MKCLCGYLGYYIEGLNRIKGPEFIKIGSVELITEIQGISRHPGMVDGLLHGMTELYACPICGTVKIDTRN